MSIWRILGFAIALQASILAIVSADVSRGFAAFLAAVAAVALARGLTEDANAD